jgi:GT2 family glycosyltransferase
MPVRNRAHLLEAVLDRLARNTTYANTELVTVDDGSEDGSPEVLRRWATSGRLPRMKLVETSHRGAVASLNTALESATGEFCVQLDDDVTIETRGWIERMLELMAIDDAVGVVTGKVVFDSGEIHACGVNVIGPAGWHERGMRPMEPIGHRQWINRVAERPREGAGGEIEHRVAEVDSGIGCFMMFRRADALAAGGYDEQYSPVWFDDVDLCLGIRAIGRKIFYLPNVRAIHHFGARRTSEHGLAMARLGHVAIATFRRVAGRLPPSAGAAVEQRYDFDLFRHYTREQCARLRHHHEYWRSKWGWDARNPDMDEVQRRWGHTEICWATDHERRAAGERIVGAYEAWHRETVRAQRLG